MDIAAPTDQVATIACDARLARETASRSRLWPSLTAAWTRRLDQRIDDDLSWFDHGGALRGYPEGVPVAERRGQAPAHPLTADLAGVLAMAQQERD